MGTLGRAKTDRFEVYGYCLMSNHVHLLIHEKNDEIHQIMKRMKMEIQDTCLTAADCPGNRIKSKYSL
ncbi:MAG TPA: hypothetical protein DD719_00235 [Desulfotomaculum sp.]|nr:hypothetical protein [Desulfotomaculum sp.]